eukprot:CAMPEP_0172314854 /NCGR_PEP_ID=MMETSP1058-20130122/23370_1 /TAXON_ID=83371 /ORGANISM="Detonula confervacea, Strain CCMP 353" /LENGTH=1024 /DNA_ID=CAMNT_0013028803 /DNA_START=300 /DNA_END=3374 /DNA_ORIENTATION=-
MSNFIKKIFRRKPKDPAAAGILQSAAAASTTAAPPKQKKQKKLSRRLAKKQKKKDKLAHFPGFSSNDHANGGREGREGLAADSAAPTAPGWEEQKENMALASSAANNSHSIPLKEANAHNGNNNGGPYGNGHSPSHQYSEPSFYDHDSIYDKPALSMIAEEKSPRNGNAVVSPTASAASGRSLVDNGININNHGNSNHHHHHGIDSPPQAQPQAVMTNPPIMSPMSGNKPPLTPNRLGGSNKFSTGSNSSSNSNGNNNHSNNVNLTPSQYRSPNLNRHSPKEEMTIDTSELRHSMSPDDQSLRGMRIASPEHNLMVLSADEEDEEYNRLSCKENHDGLGNIVVGPGNSAALGPKIDNNGGKQDKFVSALDRSPFSYASEEDDNALFPALVEDKDPWNHNTNNVSHHGNHPSSNNPTITQHDKSAINPNKTSNKDLNILPMAHETQEDIRAWTPSPTKKGSFTFQGGPIMMMNTAAMSAANTAPSTMDRSPTVHNNTSANAGGTSHQLHQHKQQASSSSASGQQQRHKVLFENFADFEPFDPSAQRQFHNSKSSKSVAYNSSPVSALLEDSRARRKSGQRSIEGNNFLPRSATGGGSSINSAPVLTPSHIHKLSRPKNGGSSISRVIDNLELHVNKRQGMSGGRSTRSHTSAGRSVNSHHSHSQHSKGGESGGVNSNSTSAFAIREAKERIRRENMMNNESKMIDMLAAGGSGAASAAAAANAANNGNKDNWLFDEVAGTLGPRSVAADLESLGGRSNKSGKSRGDKSHRSHRSKKSRSGNSSSHRRHRSRNAVDNGDQSVDSRTSRNSRNSYRSYQTTKSMVSQMSEQSRSVANDLLRLEAQLSMVGKSRNGGSVSGGAGSSGGSVGPPGGASVISKSERNKRRDDCGMTVTSRDFSISGRSRSSRHRKASGSSSRSSSGREHISASARRAAARTLRSKVTVIAPPGKLGIILANRTDSRGTVVSGVRTSSVLAEQVSPGDRIIAIDEEDVSQMNVKEITTIMARKSEFERVLVLLAAPKVQYD